ncbi:MAG: hypothetical protein GXP62_11635 [Oligoflexia bacterium]|nr:hypothetical protein [Oligoflexia bacterium]
MHAHLTSQGDGLVELIADGGDLPVKLAAPLRRAADQATATGPVEVYARLQRRSGGWAAPNSWSSPT